MLQALGLGDIGARLHARRVRKRGVAGPRQVFGYPPPTVPSGWMPDTHRWPHGGHGAPVAVAPRPWLPGPPGQPGMPMVAPSSVNHLHAGPAPFVSPAQAVGPHPAGRRVSPAALPTAAPQRERPLPAAGADPVSMPAWEVLAVPRREPWWVRARRYAVLVAVAVLMVTGVVTIAGTVMSWVSPPALLSAAVVVTESEFVGVAVPFAVDYVSWDEADRASRQTALTRVAAPNVTVDGWDGTGRQWADSPAVVGLVRGEGDRAVVTVRLRVIPFRLPDNVPTPSPPSGTPDPGPNVASGPVTGMPGWTAQQARWINLAVPVGKQDGRMVVLAPPVLVGSAPISAAGPALPGLSGSGDTGFAQRTQDTVTTLLRSYGTGELEYARAEGTSFTGLDSAATLDAVLAWRVSNPDQHGGGSTRVGDVTVIWALSGGAGKLKCSYRIELTNDSGRWYVVSIGAEMGVVN